MPKNDTVELLAGGIAHDFDSLLTAIVSHADTLSDYLSPGDPRAAEVVAIRQAAEQANALTRQLLAFSRTQALRPTFVDLNAVIDRMRHALQRLLGDQVALELRQAPALWRVRADGEQLEHILRNLSLNARDAMPGGGALTIATANLRVEADEARRREVDQGDYVELSVVDTGVGIESDEQAHLFEPFFTTKQRARGTGLGLAMVYGVVKQSGGSISVESEWWPKRCATAVRPHGFSTCWRRRWTRRRAWPAPCSTASPCSTSRSRPTGLYGKSAPCSNRERIVAPRKNPSQTACSYS